MFSLFQHVTHLVRLYAAAVSEDERAAVLPVHDVCVITKDACLNELDNLHVEFLDLRKIWKTLKLCRTNLLGAAY